MPLSVSGAGYQVGDGNTSEVLMGVQATPIELPIGTVNLTPAQITSGLLVTVAGTAARTHNLPTATAMSNLLVNAKVGSTFDVVMVNLGTSSGVITVQAGTGFTIVGTATIAITSSAQFRARYAADGAWVLYRIS
jgi:hypothetical protein